MLLKSCNTVAADMKSPLSVVDNALKCDSLIVSGCF